MSIWGNPVMMGGSGGGGTIVPKTITENGTYNASADNADGYDPVVVNVSRGESDIEMQASVVDGEAVTSGIVIVSQPYIVDGEFSATGSDGLQFSSELSPSGATIEMDFTPSASGGVLISFGGSNSAAGMLMLTPSLFRWYAQGDVFSESVSLTAGTQYHLKIEINSNTLLLYIDGVLSKTITNNRFANLLSYIPSGNIALLYNQSNHSEYSSSKINNLNIKVVMEL